MGRAKLPPRQRIFLNVPETFLAEIILLNPGLVNENGFHKSGALTNYFLSLARKDMEEKKERFQNEQQNRN